MEKTFIGSNRELKGVVFDGTRQGIMEVVDYLEKAKNTVIQKITTTMENGVWAISFVLFSSGGVIDLTGNSQNLQHFHILYKGDVLLKSPDDFITISKELLSDLGIELKSETELNTETLSFQDSILLDDREDDSFLRY